MVVAHIYIIRSLTGIARGDVLCKEVGPASARTAAQQTQLPREKDSLSRWGSGKYDTVKTANENLHPGIKSLCNRD